VKPVVIHSDAESELWQAVGFYEERSPGLGLNFETEIRRIIASIQEAPKRYPRMESPSLPARNWILIEFTRGFRYILKYCGLPGANDVALQMLWCAWDVQMIIDLI
jgi:hypothetical protein